VGVWERLFYCRSGLVRGDPYSIMNKYRVASFCRDTDPVEDEITRSTILVQSTQQYLASLSRNVGENANRTQDSHATQVERPGKSIGMEISRLGCEDSDFTYCPKEPGKRTNQPLPGSRLVCLGIFLWHVTE
jgi:hypothetical protein